MYKQGLCDQSNCSSAHLLIEASILLGILLRAHGVNSSESKRMLAGRACTLNHGPDVFLSLWRLELMQVNIHDSGM